MLQVVSVVGALAILAAYAANQLRIIGPPNLSYAVLNLVGSGILAVIAVIEWNWGFILLEGVWALVSLWSIIKLTASGSRVEEGGH